MHEKPCRQNRGHELFGQEDCISLDIMAPAALTDMPVFCYIHGGGFTRSDPPYAHLTSAYYAKGAGSGLPNDGKAITALFHYRLSSLGFFAHPGLSAENTYGGSGNWGYDGQHCQPQVPQGERAGLRW